MSQFNWNTTIGPGIIPHRNDTDAFLAALKAIHPDDIFPKDTPRMLDHLDHPTIHSNRMESPGNCIAGNPNIASTGSEPHGNGSHETPDVTTPEGYIDRHTHQQVTKTIMLIEAALINTAPTVAPGEIYVNVTVNIVVDGRIATLIEQRYRDVGWISAKLVQADNVRSTMRLVFP